MKSWFLVLTLVISFASFAKTSSRKPGPVNFTLVRDTVKEAEQKKTLPAKFFFFNHEYAAKPLCNEETLSNLEGLEVYKIPERPDLAVVLCPGLTDGDQNALILFDKFEQPQRQVLTPASTSFRITDDKMKNAVTTWLK